MTAMKILHLDLKPIGSDYAELRYFWDNSNDYQSRQLPLSIINELIKEAERDFYTIYPKDYAKIGQVFYKWLDGSERLLEGEINKHRRDRIVLAIAAKERLAHLPWELLHDGQRFLVERAIIPVRWKADSRQLTPENQSANRALNVLFMATSPLGIKPELDFEAEEGRILEATKRKPLSLIVEESGSLQELSYLVEDYEQDYFDVLHLTGHGGENEKPYFITETELGEPEYSSAEDIAEKLQFQLPKLIFLSGCETGRSWNKGADPSIAEELLMEGATAVLSWGKKVSDKDATATAATLYENLSAGHTVTEAVVKTYQTLIRNQAKDWHLLRLYVAETLPGSLVTPLRTPGHKPAPLPSVVTEFLDTEGKIRVASRESFIGRRRQLQNCLRALKTPNEKIGVLIHSMGGLGKSSIASRLCDRLSEHRKIIWWQQIDEDRLVSKLAEQIRNEEQQTAFKQSRKKLGERLRDLFNELNKSGEKPFVLVFDDFEWNLELREKSYILKSSVAPVLRDLIWAIKNQENVAEHRIIITCRYDFEFDSLRYFYKQGLQALRDADLQKKLKQLEAFNSDAIDEKLIERAIKLADGNPRLLEWLNGEVLSKENADSKLSQFEADPQEWKGKIIWEDFCKLVEADPKIQKIISRCLVFEIFVPMPALEVVCDSISSYKEQLKRAIELGLIEVSYEQEESERRYRISRNLPHIISTIALPEKEEIYSLYRKALEKLLQLWGKWENNSEEKWKEIFRLAFANKENPDRFKLGFSMMLEVAYNAEAEQAFRSELEQIASDLRDNLFTQLEEYLSQNNWAAADQETLWIFYKVMAINKCHNWWEMITDEFPCEDLRAIDNLWVKYSDGRFGFSVQKKIYLEVGGIPDGKINKEASEKFFARIGWDNGPIYDITAPVGHFPFLVYYYSPSVRTIRVTLDRTPYMMEDMPGSKELVFGLFQACEVGITVPKQEHATIAMYGVPHKLLGDDYSPTWHRP